METRKERRQGERKKERNGEIKNNKEKNFKNECDFGEEGNKEGEKTWFHSKDVVTVDAQSLLEKRKGPRPLCNYYYIIKSNKCNSLEEVTACIVDGI